MVGIPVTEEGVVGNPLDIGQLPALHLCLASPKGRIMGGADGVYLDRLTRIQSEPVL